MVHNNGPGQVAAINIVQEVDNPQLEAVDISNRLLRVLEDSANFTENEKAIINDYIMDYDPYGELMGITIEGFEATGIVGDENVLRMGILPQARELVANRKRAEQEEIKRRLALEMDRVEKENPDLKPNADDTCPICLFEDDLRPIRCRHLFHIDCIAKHLTITQVDPDCAICKTNLYDLVRPIA